MNTATKLAAFAAVVAATFGGAMAVGAAVGPIDVGGSSDGHSSHGTGGSAATEIPRGLAIAQAGYRLVTETVSLPPAAPTAFAFRIMADDGTTVTSFALLHERALHLIVLSRNMVDELHLHPTMDASGRWTVDLPALTPGSYRIFADFQPTGAENLTLGTDLLVPGATETIALPAPAATDTVDGYTVTLAGAPVVGAVPLTFTVQLAGQAVHTDPYLGAAGHLIAIRAGDLAYLHVHPETGGDAAATDITFIGEFPSAGTYRLFLDFSHGGAVHTASFTVVVPDGAGGEPMTMQEGH